MTTVPPQDLQDPEAPRGGFFALMRHRNYALLWTGQLISHLGDRFHWVAISLWVYAQTGSALSVSFAIVALMVAPAVVGFFAGAVVDRLDRRKIMIAADLARAVLVAAIPWLMTLGLPWVYFVLFLVSAASAFFRPAMFAAIPQSVPRDRLLQANAFFASLESAVEVVGPALAGLLVTRFQYAAAMYLDAVSYLISAAFVAGLVFPRADLLAAARRRATTRIWQSVREGLQYIRGDRIQIALLALLFAGQWVVGLSSLQTPLAKGVLGISDRQFGWFQSIWGVGFIGASLLLGWYGRRIARGQAIVLGYVLWALAAGAMGLSANYAMLVVTGFWVGFANILVFVNVSTVMMEHTPSDKIGRTITVRQVGVSIVRVAALLGFGWLSDVTGARIAILAMATVAFAGSLVASLRFSSLWHYQPAEVWPEPTAIYGLPLAEPGWSHMLGRVAGARIDPAFIPSEQRWLNAASLTIVVLGWIQLFVVLPAQAVGLAAAAALAMAVVGAIRWWGQNMRGGSRQSTPEPTSGTNDLAGGKHEGAYTKSTGPTAG